MKASEAQELAYLLDRAILELIGEIREVEMAMSTNKRWLSKHYRRPFGQETEEEYWERLHRGIESKREILAKLREQKAKLVH